MVFRHLSHNKGVLENLIMV